MPLSSRSLSMVWLAWMAMLGVGCANTATTQSTPTADTAIIANSEERLYSEILQGNQRILMQIELVDGVRPPRKHTVGNRKAVIVPSGARRIQFRVYLPSVGWNDGNGREARAAVDVELRAGHTYQFTGSPGAPTNHILLRDLTTGDVVTPPIDVGFFAPVPHGGSGYIPIILPIKI